jgi:hypothetical protein
MPAVSVCDCFARLEAYLPMTIGTWREWDCEERSHEARQTGAGRAGNPKTEQQTKKADPLFRDPPLISVYYYL